MSTLTRDLYVPCIDKNTILPIIGKETSGEGYNWGRIDKSTIFELSFNPQEETSGYIDAPNDSTYVKSYQPELPQEIILDSDNPIYALLQPFFMAMPTGSNAKVPFLLVLPNMDDGKPTLGYVWDECILSPSSLSSVDGKLSFSCKLNGTVKVGTVAIDGGNITFSESNTVALAGNSAPVIADWN